MKLKLDAGMAKKEDLVEDLRKTLVACTRIGSQLVLNMGKLVPDFKSAFTDDKEFPADIIFDREAWLQEENHMKLVKESENYDLSGNKD